MQNIFLFQKIHEPTLKKEVNSLIKIGVLKKIYNLQWAAPSFTIRTIFSYAEDRLV